MGIIYGGAFGIAVIILLIIGIVALLGKPKKKRIVNETKTETKNNNTNNNSNYTTTTNEISNIFYPKDVNYDFPITLTKRWNDSFEDLKRYPNDDYDLPVSELEDYYVDGEVIYKTDYGMFDCKLDNAIDRYKVSIRVLNSKPWEEIGYIKRSAALDGKLEHSTIAKVMVEGGDCKVFRDDLDRVWLEQKKLPYSYYLVLK